MKLAPLPLQESSIKLNLSFKQSTSDLLESYGKCYKEAYGHSAVFRDMVEHMLLGYMQTDKDFQSWRQDQLNRPIITDKKKKLNEASGEVSYE